MTWTQNSTEIEQYEWIIEAVQNDGRILTITTGTRGQTTVYAVSETLDTDSKPENREYATFYIADSIHTARLALEMAKEQDQVPTNVQPLVDNTYQ